MGSFDETLPLCCYCRVRRAHYIPDGAPGAVCMDDETSCYYRLDIIGEEALIVECCRRILHCRMCLLSTRRVLLGDLPESFMDDIAVALYRPSDQMHCRSR